MLTKLVARFGFVPVHRYDALRRANDEARTATLAWKEKAGEVLKKLERSDTQLKRHIRALRHARADVDKLQQRVAEFDRLREKLGQTKEALMIARLPGTSSAPPAPWSALAAMSWPPSCARPQATEASVNSATPTMKMRRLPK